MTDPINPDHYRRGAIEAIDFLQDTFTPQQFEGYLRGNAMKYLIRYDKKNGLEDVQKAQWYIERLVWHLQSA